MLWGRRFVGGGLWGSPFVGPPPPCGYAKLRAGGSKYPVFADTSGRGAGGERESSDLYESEEV